MNTIYEFLLHVDPSLLNFKFKEASYITVRYGRVLDTAIVFETVIPAHIARNLNNMPELYKQAESAASHNLLSHHKPSTCAF